MNLLIVKEQKRVTALNFFGGGAHFSHNKYLT